jgi:hypothetical protein
MRAIGGVLVHLNLVTELPAARRNADAETGRHAVRQGDLAGAGTAMRIVSREKVSRYAVPRST